MNRIDFAEFTSPIAKSTSTGLSDTTLHTEFYNKDTTMDKTVSRPGGLFKETVNSALNVN